MQVSFALFLTIATWVFLFNHYCLMHALDCQPFNFKHKFLLISNLFQKLEKDLGFLRIGSLNVRVKKTTEAFSNFLGVGNNNSAVHTMPNVAHSNRMVHARSSAPPTGSHFDKIHKNWGSADNIPPVSGLC